MNTLTICNPALWQSFKPRAWSRVQAHTDAILYPGGSQGSPSPVWRPNPWGGVTGSSLPFELVFLVTVGLRQHWRLSPVLFITSWTDFLSSSWSLRESAMAAPGLRFLLMTWFCWLIRAIILNRQRSETMVSTWKKMEAPLRGGVTPCPKWRSWRISGSERSTSSSSGRQGFSLSGVWECSDLGA